MADRWENGAGATLTLQIPDPGGTVSDGSGTRLKVVRDLLAASPEVRSFSALSDEQVQTLLGSWLGTDASDIASKAPAVIAVHMAARAANLNDLAARLNDRAPGIILEDHADGPTG